MASSSGDFPFQRQTTTEPFISPSLEDSGPPAFVGKARIKDVEEKLGIPLPSSFMNSSPEGLINDRRNSKSHPTAHREWKAAPTSSGDAPKTT
jgi:hypothetical protein